MNVKIEKIVEILRSAGKPAPIENVRNNWPLVENELAGLAITSTNALIAAIATIAVETGSFAPCKERGGPPYFVKHYYENRELAKRLGNTSADDAVAYRGRGFVQITGRANYETIGAELGVDLVERPDLALDPVIAAKVFATFFRDHRVADAADAAKWELVRRRVNGGLNSWAEFAKIVQGLKSATGEPIPPLTIASSATLATAS